MEKNNRKTAETEQTLLRHFAFVTLLRITSRLNLHMLAQTESVEEISQRWTD